MISEDGWLYLEQPLDWATSDNYLVVVRMQYTYRIMYNDITSQKHTHECTPTVGSN